ncbi:DUF1810 domain-containing protein [Sphingopyxis sp. GW247-27LB]|uniref:DUF1810 domain-containing protein n=1 Tax=Sphingopyxis sp. GW247-27LB TaxID=2012632 RepID=UPI000BA77E81|nr:DUF1810 domain-containing protein [Sphingopyxis sp. GW247-27LB]PAL24273.1 calpastatin [Sphingopyxis sp. GW247-27LB]
MSDDGSLDRFVEAQTLAYAIALAEIRRGAKRTHWMWFIFPQIAGLGRSATARHFAIRSIDEARAYLDHPVLGPRYDECVAALQDLTISDPVAVFGEVDALKLRSSLTLFESARPDSLVAAAIDRWFGGKRDEITLRILGADQPETHGDGQAA